MVLDAQNPDVTHLCSPPISPAFMFAWHKLVSAVVCDHVSTIVANHLVEGRKLVSTDQDHGSCPVRLILIMRSGGPLRFERIRKRTNREIHRQVQISVDYQIEVNGDGRSLLVCIGFGIEVIRLCVHNVTNEQSPFRKALACGEEYDL